MTIAQWIAAVILDLSGRVGSTMDLGHWVMALIFVLVAFVIWWGMRRT